MKDQMTVIAEALENRNENWGCRFRIDKEIGGHTYTITIQRQGPKLELKALFPVYLDEDNYDEWVANIRNANDMIDCGAFSLCDGGTGVCYCVYSLYTRDDEVKDAETVNLLVNSCYSALSTCGEAMLVKNRKRKLSDCFSDLVGLIRNAASD